MAEEEFKRVEWAYSELLGRSCNQHYGDDVGRPPSEDQPNWVGQATERKLPLTLQLAIMFSVPAGFLCHELKFGGLSHMLAEREILQSGGWACYTCTYVNSAGSIECTGCKLLMAQADRKADELAARRSQLRNPPP